MRKEILDVLEKNSRIDLGELAKMLGQTEVAVANEVAEMEKEHIICGYHTLIDWEKAGAEKVNALIEVTVTPQRGMGFDKIAERIYKFDEVDSVYLMSGGFDLMVMIEETTMKAVANFVMQKLSALESVRGCATHFVLKKYKDHGAILVEDAVDERMSITP